MCVCGGCVSRCCFVTEVRACEGALEAGCGARAGGECVRWGWCRLSWVSHC